MIRPASSTDRRPALVAVLVMCLLGLLGAAGPAATAGSASAAAAHIERVEAAITAPIAIVSTPRAAREFPRALPWSLLVAAITCAALRATFAPNERSRRAFALVRYAVPGRRGPPR
jgi:hypothetical protein